MFGVFFTGWEAVIFGRLTPPFEMASTTENAQYQEEIPEEEIFHS